MVMISYAHNLEDVVLERVFRTQPNGFYIDVGAGDPDCGSVTKHFYLKGWNGINIEPADLCFERLLAARPRDINLHVAIGNHGHRRATFPPFDGTDLSGPAETPEHWASDGAGFVARAIDVEIRPLSEIITRYAPPGVDFLKIDVEGGERSVIESAEWQVFRPRVVIVGAITPLTHRPAWFAWEGLLLEAGYCLALFDGLNRFYHRAEEPELKDALSVPANVLDGYCPMQYAALQDRLAGLEAMVAQRTAGSKRR